MLTYSDASGEGRGGFAMLFSAEVEEVAGLLLIV